MSPGEQVARLLGQIVDQDIAKKALEELSALRARAIAVQEAALTAASLPTAEGVAKLERRLRSARDAIVALGARVDGLEAQLRGVADLRAELGALRAEIAELTRRLDQQA